MSDKLMPRQGYAEFSPEDRKAYSTPLVIRLGLASTAMGPGANFDASLASTSGVLP